MKQLTDEELFSLLLKMEHGLAEIDSAMRMKIVATEQELKTGFLYSVFLDFDSGLQYTVQRAGKQWMQEYLKRHAPTD
jgi:hypothetical protein